MRGRIIAGYGVSTNSPNVYSRGFRVREANCNVNSHVLSAPNRNRSGRHMFCELRLTFRSTDHFHIRVPCAANYLLFTFVLDFWRDYVFANSSFRT